MHHLFIFIKPLFVLNYLGTDLPSATSVCSNKMIYTSAGRIYSPGFPNAYSNNLRCSVTIVVPFDKALEIVINYYDIECKLNFYALSPFKIVSTK